MHLTIHNEIDPNRDYRYLELAQDDLAWSQGNEQIRILLVAFNIPGYYSLAVRILSLTTALTDDVNEKNDVRYIELDLGEDWKWLTAAIERWSPEIIGFTANIWNIATVVQVIKEIKVKHPRMITLLGGQEVSGSIDDLMAIYPDIDYILEGEGEVPFLQFLAYWDRSSRKLLAPRKVSGLRYRENGAVVSSGPARIIDDLDQLPSPILAGLVPVGTKNKLGVMLEGTRGCPYRCSFCFEGSRITKVRMASLERLSAEAHFMAARGATYFHLMDPILCNSKPERIKGIADLFKDLSRQYKLQISLETYAQHINDRIASYLSEFTILDVGLQSINSATQKAIHRSFHMKRFQEGLASLRRVNPNFNLYLICGLPNETLLSFLQGIEFVLGERPVRIFINELCLLNGTQLRRQAAEYGYEFNPTPPYEVYASKWMDRFEMKLANTFSGVLSRQFNLSIRALLPLAPWVKHAPTPAGKKLVLNLCKGGAAGGTGLPDAVARIGGGQDLKESAGADVEIIVAEQPCTPQAQRMLGQLQLMGASRLKITGPMQAFSDCGTVEKLVALGVLHFKTFLEAGNDGWLPSGSDGSDRLKHIGRTFNMKGYASLRPFFEIVVLHSGEDLKTYRNFVVSACQSPAELVSIPACIADRGDAWVREMSVCFREAVNSGKWLKVPAIIARKAMNGIRDRDAVLAFLHRLDLLSSEPNVPPYMMEEHPGTT